MSDLTPIRARLSEIEKELSAIELQREPLLFERNEIETALVVLSRYGEPHQAPAAPDDQPELVQKDKTPSEVPASSAGESTGKNSSSSPADDYQSDANEGGDHEVEPDTQLDENTGPAQKAGRAGGAEASASPVEIGAQHDPDAAPGESADAKISPPTMSEQIRSALKEDPQLTVPQLAKLLGKKAKHIRAAAERDEIEIRKVSTEERAAAVRAGRIAAADANATRKPPDEKPALTVVENPPPEPSLRIATKAKFFRLRDKTTGKYLHQSVSRGIDKKQLMTNLRGYPWQGTEAQLVAVRRKLPETVDMMTEPVES